MIISKTKGKRILLVHDLCDHNTLDESALDKLSNVLGEHEIRRVYRYNSIRCRNDDCR